MTDQPTLECGPACSEQHTYRLDGCVLCCVEMHGSVAQPAWVVPCPDRRCQAPADRPCLRNGGSPAGVCHEARFAALDRARDATPPQDGPHAPQDGPEAPGAGAEPLARLQRLRGQLAAEQAKAVRADQHPRPDLDHLRVTPHNGIAAGLEIAIFFADHHLREAREETRTTPDNPATSGNAADNQLRADAEAWRHKAIRRALAISKLRGTIDACIDLADEPVTDRTGWGDGYRAAIGDLREVLREFGHLEPAAAEPGEQP